MEIKKEWKYFTIFNHEKEEEYLRNQHRAGWKFLKVTGISFYHFEKCHPDDVVYQLDYNKEGLENKLCCSVLNHDYYLFFIKFRQKP